MTEIQNIQLPKKFPRRTVPAHRCVSTRRGGQTCVPPRPSPGCYSPSRSSRSDLCGWCRRPMQESPASRSPRTRRRPSAATRGPAGRGSGFLLPGGHTGVWSGWDAAAGTNGAGFNTRIGGPAGPSTPLPIAKNPDGSTITGPAYEYIVTSGSAAFPLTYPAANPADKVTAVLTHRVHLDDVPMVVPASGWAYNAAGTSINLVPPGWASQDIYEFTYT